MRVHADPAPGFIERYHILLIATFMAAAHAFGAPPQTTWGSEAVEHLEDLLAGAIAAAGLSARLILACRPYGGRAARRHTLAATLTVAFGLLLMHGDPYVLGFGVPGLLLLYWSAREPAAGPEPRGRSTSGQAPAPAFRLPPPAVLAREWLVVVATAAILLFTEVHEYMPPARSAYTRGILLVLALALAAWTFTLRRDAARQRAGAKPIAAGPNTSGIRVDGRVRSVDLFENALSFGNLKPILASTLAAAELRAGGTLLDIGCGSGKLAIAAARLVGPAGRATGLDATPGMVELARERARQSGSAARFRLGAAEELPWPNGNFDAVTSSYFFHHLPSGAKRLALREMWRVLAPGGRLVVTDYARPRSLLGLIASLPMRVNFYEHVRGQLRGELEALLAEETGEPVERFAVFAGYITVFRLTKPGGAVPDVLPDIP